MKYYIFYEITFKGYMIVKHILFAVPNVLLLDITYGES